MQEIVARALATHPTSYLGLNILCMTSLVTYHVQFTGGKGEICASGLLGDLVW